MGWNLLHMVVLQTIQHTPALWHYRAVGKSSKDNEHVNTHSHTFTYTNVWWNILFCKQMLRLTVYLLHNCAKMHIQYINTRFKHEVRQDCARRPTGDYQLKGNLFFKMKSIFCPHKMLNILSNVKTKWFMFLGIYRCSPHIFQLTLTQHKPISLIICYFILPNYLAIIQW